MHKSLLRRGKHHSIHLQRAWNRDGNAAFLFELLEAVPVDQLLQVEQWHLDKIPLPLYNIAKFADAPTRGRVMSDAEKEKRRIASIKAGNKPPNHKGMKRSPETCMKIGDIHRGRKRSAEARSNMRRARLAWLERNKNREINFS